jgi:small-conductance mechanosensitive channel
MNELATGFPVDDLRALALATVTALGCGLLLVTVRRLVCRRLRHAAAVAEMPLADIAATVVEGTRTPFLVVLSCYAGLQLLDVSSRLAGLADGAITAVVLLQVALWGNCALAAWARSGATGRWAGDGKAAGSMAVLGFLARVVLWVLVLLVLLDNLGVNITALVASLGIGGIAVALAVQNVLGDILASLSIVLDQPFEKGDFIVVDDTMGTVEYIGVKTTRLRSLSGEQVVCANADLLKARIRNFKRMYERRVLFRFGIVYQTPPELVERIPCIVAEIVGGQPNTRFERAHFASFGDSSLDFEVVYHVLDPDYGAYMDTQQAINLGLLRSFDDNGIGFAYPTRTLLIENAPDPRPCATGRRAA